MRLRSTGTRGRAARVLAVVAVAGLALSACAESDREPEGGGEGSEAASGGTFVFAASSDPVVLDPAFASDGETFRVARQMFEGLVGTVPGTADPAPLLAKSWTTSEDGLSYTFVLEEGVKFHDGTDFNADAVCVNFERWYNWTGLQQSPNITAYYRDIFQGFRTTRARRTGSPSTSRARRAPTSRRPSTSPARSRPSRQRSRCPASRCSRPRRWRSTTPTTSAAPRTTSGSARTAPSTPPAPARSSSTAGSARSR